MIDWNKIPIGTQIKYREKSADKMIYGYFAGVFKPTECIIVSKIPHDIEFTNTSMTSWGVCDYIKIKYVELYK